MSRVVSLRLRDEQMERMQRLARRLNRSVGETSALLLEEALRMAEFAFIQFRDSIVGRQAYVQGTGLAVWEVVFVARSNGMDVARAAAHLEWPENKVQAALNYAAAYPDEIQAALEDNDKDFDELARMLPGLRRFSVGDTDSPHPADTVPDITR